MKKTDPKQMDLSDQDQKLQSRMQLKNKLNFVGNEFSISRLTDSINDHNKLTSLFPQINQPTLDIHPQLTTQPILSTKQIQNQYHNLYTDNHSHKNKNQKNNGYNNHDVETIRNNHTQKNYNSQLAMLQKQNNQLLKQLKQQRSQIIKLKKNNDKLLTQINQFKRQQQNYKNTIQKQQQTILQLKSSLNKSKSKESKQSINSTISLFQDSIDTFCPQMLSPQQTVHLLQKLLKKVSKSVKMIRRLSKQGTIHVISNIINQQLKQ